MNNILESTNGVLLEVNLQLPKSIEPNRCVFNFEDKRKVPHSARFKIMYGKQNAGEIPIGFTPGDNFDSIMAKRNNRNPAFIESDIYLYMIGAAYGIIDAQYLYEIFYNPTTNYTDELRFRFNKYLELIGPSPDPMRLKQLSDEFTIQRAVAGRADLIEYMENGNSFKKKKEKFDQSKAPWLQDYYKTYEN